MDRLRNFLAIFIVCVSVMSVLLAAQAGSLRIMVELENTTAGLHEPLYATFVVTNDFDEEVRGPVRNDNFEKRRWSRRWHGLAAQKQWTLLSKA